MATQETEIHLLKEAVKELKVNREKLAEKVDSIAIKVTAIDHIDEEVKSFKKMAEGTSISLVKLETTMRIEFDSLKKSMEEFKGSQDRHTAFLEKMLTGKQEATNKEVASKSELEKIKLKGRIDITLKILAGLFFGGFLIKGLVEWLAK